MAEAEKQQEQYGEADVYFEHEVNLLHPKTPYMREFLRNITPLMIIYLVLLVFGPGIIFLTATNPDGTGPLTEATFLWFPAHWFIAAWFVPVGCFILAIIFAVMQDRLSAKYGKRD